MPFPANLKPGVLTGADVLSLLQYAKDNKFGT